MHYEKPVPSRTRQIALLVTVVAIVLVDQFSKSYAIANWKNSLRQSYLGDVFRIEYAENEGAFLSLLANLPDDVRFWILTVINGAVLLGIGAYLIGARQVPLSTFLPLTLVVAGGLGNLIDRIRFNYVVDFFNLGVGSVRTGIFNVADMAITAGFLLMLPLVFRNEEARPIPPPELSTPGEQRPA